MGCGSSVEKVESDRKYASRTPPPSNRQGNPERESMSSAKPQTELEPRETMSEETDSDPGKQVPLQGEEGASNGKGSADRHSKSTSESKSKSPPPPSSWAKHVITQQQSGSNDALSPLTSFGSRTFLTPAQLVQYDPNGSPRNDTMSMVSGRAEQELGASFSTAHSDQLGVQDTNTVQSASAASATGSVKSETLMRRAQRLEQALERRLSEGDLADEPSRIGEQFKMKALVAKARLLNGITSDVDQFKENIEKENLKYLQIQPEKLLRICEYVDLLIEAMLDFPMVRPVGSYSYEPMDACSHSGRFSAKSEEGLGPESGAPSPHTGAFSPPLSRRTSLSSTADLPGTVPAQDDVSPSALSIQIFSPDSKPVKTFADGSISMLPVTSVVKVLEYEVFLSTANLVNQDGSVAPSSPTRNTLPLPQQTMGSPNSGTRSPQQRLLSDTSSNCSFRGRAEKTPQTMGSHKQNVVDEVDELIFGA